MYINIYPAVVASWSQNIQKYANMSKNGFYVFLFFHNLTTKIKSNTRFEYTVGKISSFRTILAIQKSNPTKLRSEQLTRRVSETKTKTNNEPS